VLRFAEYCLGITTVGRMTNCLKGFLGIPSINDNQRKNAVSSTIMLSVIMLSVIMLSVIMLSVIVLSVIMLSVIMLSVSMLSGTFYLFPCCVTLY
jgi:hypothetical protein